MSRGKDPTFSSLGRMPSRHSRNEIPVPPEDPDDDEGRGRIGRFLHHALFVNTGLKFLSLVLAVTVFLLVNIDKDREITVRVGVKYEYPADKVLVSEQLEEVRVTVRGPWRRLRQFDERELGRIELDLRNAPTGDVSITKDMIPSLPAGLEIVSISPSSVRVVFDKRAEKIVEVFPTVTGRPQHGYVMAEIKAVPPTIKVRGAARDLSKLTSIRTREVSLEGRTDSFEQLAELAVPEGVTVDPTQRIGVQVRIVEELVTKKIPSLVVTVRGDGIDPAKWKVSPGQVEVTLTGALLTVEKARESLQPFVKLSANDTKAHAVDVGLDGLPPGIGVRISPERVRVSPIK